MPRPNVVSLDQATGPVKQIYDDVTAKMGKVSNIFQGMDFIGLATFSNLFNHVHDTPLDFPAAQTLKG